jgi:hypothetical protein
MARQIINSDPEFSSRPQIDPEKAFFVITKLREFQAKQEDIPSRYAESEDASNAVDDGMREVLEDTPNDPVLEELGSFLRSLNVDELATLVALVYIGRGDFAPTEWDAAFAEAKQRDLRAATRTLVNTPLSADYLDDTMAIYGQTFDEFEQKHL